MIVLRTEVHQRAEVKLSDIEAKGAAKDILSSFPDALKEASILPGIVEIATRSLEGVETTNFRIYRYPSDTNVVRYDGSYVKQADGSNELELIRTLNPASASSLVRKLRVTDSETFAAVLYWIPPNGVKQLNTQSAVGNGKSMLAKFREGH